MLVVSAIATIDLAAKASLRITLRRALAERGALKLSAKSVEINKNRDILFRPK
jgi:hypothetical protein